MGKNQVRRGFRGFTLLETLITALLVELIVAGLLHFTGHVLACYHSNQVESREALELWNRGRDIRRVRPNSPDTFCPVAGARPLHRFILSNRNGRQWEVLCAEK